MKKNLNQILFEQQSGESTEIERVKKFQDWLDENYPTWYKGGKLSKGNGYGAYGPNTRRMYENNDVKEKYTNWKKSGGVTPQTATNIESIDKDITDVAKNVTFYDTAGRLIEWLDFKSNESFDTDPNMVKIVTLANRRKTGGDTPIIAYIKSVLSYLRKNVSEIDVEDTYKTDIDSYINSKTPLIENTYLKPVIGLSKILLDETRIRYLIKNDDGKLFISGQKTSVNRGNLDSSFVISQYKNNNVTYFKPLSLVSSNKLPDAAPLVGEVKIKLDAADGNNVFTQNLKDKIIKYRKDNNIAHAYDEGDIDFYLIQSLFADKFK